MRQIGREILVKLKIVKREREIEREIEEDRNMKDRGKREREKNN